MRDRERGNRPTPPGQDQSGPDQVLEALLAGRPLPGQDPAGLQPVADVLAALRAPAAPAELTGQASALAEFRAQPHRSGSQRSRSRRARRTFRPRPVLALAAALVVAGLTAGGYEGDLPAPVQQWAHHTFGLTAARTKTPHSPRHPHPAATPDPAPDRSHHPRRNRPAQLGPTPGGSRLSQHEAGHRSGDRDGHQHDGWPGGPGPSSGGPSSSPSPTDPRTPQPSTSPFAQPSPQPSSSPSSPDPNRSTSPPP